MNRLEITWKNHDVSKNKSHKHHIEKLTNHKLLNNKNVY